MAKLKLARPVVRTPVSSYYTSQSKEERERNARNRTSILNDKPLKRLSKRYKVKAYRKKSSGGAGG